MTLAEYMAWKGLKDAEVAEAIGVSRTAVLRYRLGQMKPDGDTIAGISRWSRDNVRFEDWGFRERRRAAQ